MLVTDVIELAGVNLSELIALSYFAYCYSLTIEKFGSWCY